MCFRNLRFTTYSQIRERQAQETSRFSLKNTYIPDTTPKTAGCVLLAGLMASRHGGVPELNFPYLDGHRYEWR